MSASLAMAHGLEAEFAPISAVDRRFGAILLVSLVLHVLVGWFMKLPQRSPEPPLILASIRLLPAATPATPVSEVRVTNAEALAASAPRAARLPPKARQPVVREEQRSAQHLSTPAGPTIASSAAPVKTAEPPASLASVNEASAAAKAPSASASTPASAAANPAPAAPTVDALAAYRRQLIEIFARPHEYPRIAAMRGWEGEVRLRLKVARKGNLLGILLDQSSGFDVLDQHALAMLEGHGDLPPLPDGLSSNEISVVVPISYKLRKTI